MVANISFRMAEYLRGILYFRQVRSWLIMLVVFMLYWIEIHNYCHFTMFLAEQKVDPFPWNRCNEEILHKIVDQ